MSIGEQALENLLDRRLQNAWSDRVSSRTVGEIIEQVKQETSGTEPHA